MTNAALLVGAILSPSIAFAAVLLAIRLWRRSEGRRPGPVAVGPPIEHIAADLRRLRRQRLQFAGQEPGPGRGLRTRALDSAYMDVLGAACRALDADPPQTDGAAARAEAEIRRAEADLRRRGLEI